MACCIYYHNLASPKAAQPHLRKKWKKYVFWWLQLTEWVMKMAQNFGHFFRTTEFGDVIELRWSRDLVTSS